MKEDDSKNPMTVYVVYNHDALAGILLDDMQAFLSKEDAHKEFRERQQLLKNKLIFPGIYDATLSREQFEKGLELFNGTPEEI